MTLDEAIEQALQVEGSIYAVASKNTDEALSRDIDDDTRSNATYLLLLVTDDATRYVLHVPIYHTIDRIIYDHR